MERKIFDVSLFKALFVIGVLLEPGNVKKKKTLAPVILFATVPHEDRRNCEYEVALPSELRCEAAKRPSVPETGNYLFWRCANPKVSGDNLCRQHRASANANGIKSWSSQCSK